MLAVALFMASMAAPLASTAAPPASTAAPLAPAGASGSKPPASLYGHVMESHITQGTDVYTQFVGRDFVTSFTAEGHYIDTEVDGVVADAGSYTYRVTGPNTAELVYHVSAESLLQAGGDYTEQLTFKTPTSGTASGVASTASATYKSTFVIKQ
jgi:hypothetical protein